MEKDRHTDIHLAKRQLPDRHVIKRRNVNNNNHKLKDKSKTDWSMNVPIIERQKGNLYKDT